MEYMIRNVQQGDERDLAYIQTESWKYAFKDILSDELLQKNTEINHATAMYKRLLDEHIGNGYILMVNGKPHCIAWWDKARDAEMTGYAELICIHSLQNKWRQGYGTKMMNQVFEDIKSAGYCKVMLWVFEKNVRARFFYEKCGFITYGKSKSRFNAVEICYEKEL